jgi:hypothetical protein
LAAINDTELSDETGPSQACLKFTLTTQEPFRLARCTLQRLLHQVADRPGGRRSHLAVGVGQENINFGTASGLRLCTVETDEEARGATIEVPLDRRQCGLAVGDDYLDAALKAGRQSRTVADDLYSEAGAEALG